MGVIKLKLDKFFGEMQRVLARNIRTELTQLGVEAVNRAREDHPNNWQDQTGNLRSSIGFAYYEQGKKLIESAFEAVGSGTQGSQKGKEYVDKLATELASTYALAVVAGMDYASYVEAKGRDVIAGTELWLREEVKKRIHDAVEDTIADMNKQRI